MLAVIAIFSLFFIGLSVLFSKWPLKVLLIYFKVKDDLTTWIKDSLLPEPKQMYGDYQLVSRSDDGIYLYQVYLNHEWEFFRVFEELDFIELLQELKTKRDYEPTFLDCSVVSDKNSLLLTSELNSYWFYFNYGFPEHKKTWKDLFPNLITKDSLIFLTLNDLDLTEITHGPDSYVNLKNN
jgi:hypothetical protein